MSSLSRCHPWQVSKPSYQYVDYHAVVTLPDICDNESDALNLPKYPEIGQMGFVTDTGDAGLKSMM